MQNFKCIFIKIKIIAKMCMHGENKNNVMRSWWYNL